MAIDLASARSYNKRKSGRLWKQANLPPPLNDAAAFPVDGDAFASVVASFQQGQGLLVDGKLGTDTLSTMRAVAADNPGELQPDDASLDDAEDGLVETSVESAAPARKGVSNKLRIGGQSVDIPQYMLDVGITASNFVDDEEHQFTQKRDRTADDVIHFVHHESVSTSVGAVIRTLDAKRRRSAAKGKNRGNGYDYGIHLIGAPDGHITCHADLITDRLVHASQLNDSSIGIEWVNPYNPKFAKGPPFHRVIPGEWWTWKPRNAERVYTLPTDAQLRAAAMLSRFMAEAIPGIPLAFPTAHLGRRIPRIKNWRNGAKPGAGIVAHRDFASHADGRFLLEHAMAELL